MRVGGWFPEAGAGVRRLLDAALLLVVAATFFRWGSQDVLLDALWVILAIGAFVFTLRRTLLRIVLVMGIQLGFAAVAATGLGQPFEFEMLDLTEWPLIVIIAVVVALMADRVTGSARRYAALYRQASERLVTAHEDERARLARDLHDGVGQTLTAALLTLDAAGTTLNANAKGRSAHQVSTADARVAVGRARALVGSALDDARDVAARLRPLRLHEIGLGAGLKALAATAGTPVELHFPARRLPPGLLSPERLIDVYRIVQEAVSNAARHSGAKHIWIKATVTEGELRIEVGDDGVGFDRPALPVGLGLPGMEERAAILGGRLDVRSITGVGTHVNLVVPLVAPAEAAELSPAHGKAAEAVI